MLILADSSAATPHTANCLKEIINQNSNREDTNALVGAAESVASVLRRKGEQEISVEGAEADVRVLAAMVALDGIEDANKKRFAVGLAADAAASAASLARMLRGGSGLEARIDAARLVEFLLVNAAGEAKKAVAKSSELVAELIRLVGPVDENGSLDMKAVDTGLSCLATISRAVQARMPALHATAEPGLSAKALRILESAVGCAEGRAALCEDTEEAVPAVVGKMKAGHDGAEAAVAVLWAVCHKYKDRRAVDAVA
ncbi:hypothetical protein E2562_013911 [Oryza meyeriana var. granulata]|uniref:U-box domain-containing protein n=1 Tax=Oryza meyeriana var. granulata TaxID=110450 RepID=A0A6G1C5Z7_9ORYZ|nr:hypothetical protein E2562_013911 [Oryza meyeriana var. granulata]